MGCQQTRVTEAAKRRWKRGRKRAREALQLAMTGVKPRPIRLRRAGRTLGPS